MCTTMLIRRSCVYDSVEEGGGRGMASGRRLEGRLCSMLTVMLGGDLDVATWLGLRLGLGLGFSF